VKKATLFTFVITLFCNIIHSQNNYPLGQTPAIGDKEFTIIIATLGGQAVPNSTISRVNAAVNTFNEYSNQTSGGKIRVSSIITPVLTINDNPAGLENKLALMRQVAEENGFNVNVPYLGYVVIASDVQIGGLGSGNGTTGRIIMGGNNLWIPGIVHEMIHMFSVGHAHIREAGTDIFPGEVQGGRDPYYFMGSEGDLKNCPVNTNQCDIFATLSLPHKGRFAWIESDEYEINFNDENEKFFKIFNHDNTTRTTKEKLGIYLKGYDNNGVFVVSYLKVPDLDQRVRLSKDGVMIHYVPYISPAISELLDLTPNSITSNPERPDDPTYTDMHDAGDGTLREGESVDVSDLFNIEIIKENIEVGENNHSVEFKITPLTCAIVEDTPFSKEDFIYTEIGTDNLCVESFSNLWNLNADSRNIVTIDNQSVDYPILVSEGNSLKIPLDNTPAPRNPALHMRRNLETPYTYGDTMWLGYLLQVNDVRDGHIFVSPNSNINIGIGKRWSNVLGINNTSITPRPLVNGETVFLVAKYEINPGSLNDNVYLWANPNVNEPMEQDAVTYKENINIGEITEINVNFQSVGDFNIDRIAVAHTYENLIDTALSNPGFSNEVTFEPYPNPVKNILNLSKSKSAPLDITIYSSLGKKVMQFKDFSKNKIDLSTLSSGLFFLKIEDQNIKTSKTYKLIKN